MLEILSSNEATAAANIVVFGGLAIAVFRVSKRMLLGFASRYSRIARKVSTSLALADLKKIREYREDRFRSVYDFAKHVFDDLVLTAFFLTFIFLFSGWYMNFEIGNNLEGERGDIWEVIVRDPTYWWDMAYFQFGFPLLVGFLFFWATRNNLKFLRLAAYPDEMRRQIIDRYLKQRSAR